MDERVSVDQHERTLAKFRKLLAGELAMIRAEFGKANVIDDVVDSPSYAICVSNGLLGDAERRFALRWYIGGMRNLNISVTEFIKRAKSSFQDAAR